MENADLSAAAEQSKGEFEQAEAGYATLPVQVFPNKSKKRSSTPPRRKARWMRNSKSTTAARNSSAGRNTAARIGFRASRAQQARSQYEQAQKQLDDLHRIGKQQALKSANGQLAAAKGKFLGAKALLSYSEIRSPIDGVVTERPLYPGELATANQPLLTVMDISKLIAKAHIPQTEAVRSKWATQPNFSFMVWTKR